MFFFFSLRIEILLLKKFICFFGGGGSRVYLVLSAGFSRSFDVLFFGFLYCFLFALRLFFWGGLSIFVEKKLEKHTNRNYTKTLEPPPRQNPQKITNKC